MLQLPGLHLRRIGGRRLGIGVMQPAVPFGRHLAWLSDRLVDHPTPPPGLIVVVAVAEQVLADELAVAPRIDAGADGRAVPPGQKPNDELDHAAMSVTQPMDSGPDFGGD